MRRFLSGTLVAASSLVLTSTASAQTVQLPTFNSFSVNTTVIAPDAGIVTPGGIRRTGSAWRGYGPVASSSARSSATASGGVHASAVIHDFAQFDDQLLTDSDNKVDSVHRSAARSHELLDGPLLSVAEIRRQKALQRAADSSTAKQMARAAPNKRSAVDPSASRALVQRKSTLPAVRN
jgi:hypothetical protein